MRDAENPDVFVPPSTDKGLVPNLRFSFADAHMNLQDGGWSREVTQRELPIATEMAGVNRRLKTNGLRELHWHKQAEWSIMLACNARIHRCRQRRQEFHRRHSSGRSLVLSSRNPAFEPRIGS